MNKTCQLKMERHQSRTGKPEGNRGKKPAATGPDGKGKTGYYSELERSVYAALETYSNVHRGSGFNSMASTHLYEQARDIVLEYLDLNRRRYTVIFCSPRREQPIMNRIKQGRCRVLSSRDLGLPLGVSAIAAERRST